MAWKSFDDEIDARGVGKTRLMSITRDQLAGLAGGDVLKIATDPGSVADVPTFCRELGVTLVDVSEGRGEVVLFVRKR
jgi:TusA-related sulfurtransferase